MAINNASRMAVGIFADISVDGPVVGTLVVVMDRAKNLPNLRTMGKQDPYAAARLGKEAKKTDTDRRGGQTPRWDQELRFTVHDSLDYHKLKVSVFNDDKRTDLIGECWIPLDEVLRRGGGQADGWHSLNCKGRYAGEIRIELTYYDTRPKPEKQNSREQKMSRPVLNDATDEHSADRVPGPRQLSAPVKRRPLPAPTAHFGDLPEPAQSSISLPTPQTHEWEDQTEPLYQTTSHHSIDASGRPVSAGRSIHDPVEYSSTLPEAVDYYPHEHNAHQFYHDPQLPEPIPNRSQSYSEYPEVYEDSEPYAEFTDDPYALQAVYGMEDQQEQEVQPLPQALLRNERVHALSGTTPPRLGNNLPSPLLPGHRNALSESHLPAYSNEQQQEDGHISPYHPVPRRRIHPPDANLALYEQYTVDSPQEPQYSLPPLPPNHVLAGDKRAGFEYPDMLHPAPRPTYRNPAPPSHRLSYSNLPDEFGRPDSINFDDNAYKEPERRRSGDAMMASYRQPAQTGQSHSQFGVGSGGPGFYPTPRQQQPPMQSRPDPRYNNSLPRSFQQRGPQLPTRGDPRLRQHGPQPVQSTQRPLPVVSASAGRVPFAPPPAHPSLASQPPHASLANQPPHSSIANQPSQAPRPNAQARHSYSPGMQRLPVPQQAPQQSFTTPRKSVSPHSSPGHGHSASTSSVPFSPDAFDAFNPGASSSSQPESREHPSMREPTPMYSSPVSSKNASPAAVLAVKEDTTKRTPSGRVVTASGRIFDPSDHIPSSAWAPEPERKDHRPSARINVKNRFGPRELTPLGPPSAAAGAVMAHKNASAPNLLATGPTNGPAGRAVTTNKGPRGTLVPRDGPLNPTDQNARYTTHGIKYEPAIAPAIPPKVPITMTGGDPLTEEMSKIDIGPSPLQRVEQRWGGVGSSTRPRRSRFGA